MNFRIDLTAAARPDGESAFWLKHLFGPLLLLLLCLFVIHGFSLDLRWADLLYAWEGGNWRLRDNLITSAVLHEDAQRFSILLGVATLVAGAASLWWEPLKPYRRGFAFLIVSMLSGLLLVSLSKHSLPIPCPWNLQRYGGLLPLGTHWLHYQTGSYDQGGCFPAGHAAGGYCLLAWYFFARHYHYPRCTLYLLPGLLIGGVYGLDQQLRGAHFISHDLVAVAICWFVALLAYRLILLPTAAKPRRS